MGRIRSVWKGLVLLAAGAMPLALSATCDPRSGVFYLDRFDNDYGGGFFDWGFDSWFYDDDYYYDDYYVVEEYY